MLLLIQTKRETISHKVKCDEDVGVEHVGPEEAVEAEGVVEQEVLEEKEGKTFLTFSTLVNLIFVSFSLCLNIYM